MTEENNDKSLGNVFGNPGSKGNLSGSRENSGDGSFNITENVEDIKNKETSQKTLEEVIAEDVIEDSLPGGAPVYDVMDELNRKVNSMEDLTPKQRARTYDKLLAKTYGVKYGFLKEKLNDALYYVGINKYQTDLKKELSQFDEQVIKYESLTNKLNYTIEGSVEYVPKNSTESLKDFVKRVNRIPDKKKGIRFNYEFSKEIASLTKDQFLFYDSKEKDLELSLGEKRSAINELDSSNSSEARDLFDEVHNLEKELHLVRSSKEKTQNKFNTFYNATKRNYSILRRNELLLKNVDSYINKVKANKEVLESYLGGGDDLQLIYKLDYLSRDLSKRSENFDDVVDLASSQTRDSIDFINQVPDIGDISSGNNLANYVDSMNRDSRIYSSDDIVEKAREIGI